MNKKIAKIVLENHKKDGQKLTIEKVDGAKGVFRLSINSSNGDMATMTFEVCDAEEITNAIDAVVDSYS